MKFLLIMLSLLFVSSCDKGLSPPIENSKSSISGKIYFEGGVANWPPADSVFFLRVVAFKNANPEDLVGEVVSGNAFFQFETLPLFVDSLEYELEISNEDVQLNYIAVALQVSESDLFAQKAVGVYNTSGDHNVPSSIFLSAGEKRNDINFKVDFKNLPPQPF